MAFATEFVAAAQSGPSVEVVTGSMVTTSANTYNGSFTLPEGQWYVIATAASVSYSTYAARILIDGVIYFSMDGSGATTTRATAVALDVSGGRSVPIRTDYIKNKSFSLYAVRTG